MTMKQRARISVLGGRPTTAATGVALLLVAAGAATASAQSNQGLARSGQLVLSGERLFGVVSSTASVEEMGVEADVTSTSIDLGLRSGQSPWSVPRLALDGFVTDGLSLGTALGFSTTSISAGASMGGASGDVDIGSSWTLVLAPRVGYAYMLNDSVGIWPRAGLSLFFGSTGLDEGALGDQDLDGDGMPDVTFSGSDISIDGLALTAELPLVLVPVEHFAVLIAPSLDLGLSGSVSSDAAGADAEALDQDVDITDLAIHISLAGWF